MNVSLAFAFLISFCGLAYGAEDRKEVALGRIDPSQNEEGWVYLPSPPTRYVELANRDRNTIRELASSEPSEVGDDFRERGENATYQETFTFYNERFEAYRIYFYMEWLNERCGTFEFSSRNFTYDQNEERSNHRFYPPVRGGGMACALDRL